jgi:hypothetical protein
LFDHFKRLKGVILLVCHHCGNEGTEGKFCSKCGHALVQRNSMEQQEEVAAGHELFAQAGSGPNIQENRGISLALKYRDYLLSSIQKPMYTIKMSNEQRDNGLISIILFSIITPLLLYFYIKNAFLTTVNHAVSLFMDEANFKLPFSDIFFPTMILTFVVIAVLVLVIFGLMKWGNAAHTLKSTIAQFGVAINGGLLISLLALIFILIKATTIGLFLAIVAMGFVFLAGPIMIIMQQKDSQKDVMMISWIMFFLSSLILVLALRFTVGTLLENFSQYIGGFNQFFN